MFNIKIDEVILSNLAVRGLKLEEFMIITCLNLDKMSLLRAYLRDKNHDQLHAYMQSLQRKLMVKKLVDIEEFSWDNFELTDLADQVFEELAKYVLEDSTLMREPPLPVERIPKLVEDFIAIFPEGKRNAGGEYLRGNSTDVTEKLNKFLKKYKYPAETILGATSKYVKQQARDDYRWCSAAHFFINKNGVSKLATECEAFKGIDEVSENWQDNLM